MSKEKSALERCYWQEPEADRRDRSEGEQETLEERIETMTEDLVRAMIASASVGKRVAMVFPNQGKAADALSLATKMIEQTPRLAKLALYAPNEGTIYFDNGGLMVFDSGGGEVRGKMFDFISINELNPLTD